MIKNFDEVKMQLGELSDVVNKFKSEQFQLKIVDLVFRGARVDPDPRSGLQSSAFAEDASAPREGQRA